MDTTTTTQKPGTVAPVAPAAPAAPAAANTSVDALAARLTSKTAPAPNTPAAAPQTATEGVDVPELTQELTETPAEETPAGEPAETPDADPAADPAADPNAPAPEGEASTLDELRALVTGAGGDPALLNAKVIKRFDKLTALRYDAETRAAHAEEELAKLKTAAPNGAPAALNPAPFHPEIAQLDQQLANASQVVQWADAAMDAAAANGQSEVEVTDGKGAVTHYTLAQVTQFRRNAERQMTTVTVQRDTKMAKVQEEHMAAAKTNHAKALTAFPWTKVKASPEQQEAARILAEIPELTLNAEWPLWVGWIVEGRKSLAKPAAVKPAVGAPLRGKPPGSRIPPSVVLAPAAVSARVEPKQRVAQQANAQFQQTGSVNALAQRFAANSAARRAA